MSLQVQTANDKGRGPPCACHPIVAQTTRVFVHYHKSIQYLNQQHGMNVNVSRRNEKTFSIMNESCRRTHTAAR
jgi:hypothetical protein